MSVGRPLREVSRWPALSQPYRLALLSGRRVLLYPPAGNHILYADPFSPDVPEKLNLLAASSGEILVRAGLPPETFGHRSRFDRLKTAARWALVLALCASMVAWSIVNGIPFLHHLHPHAASITDRMIKFQRDKNSLLIAYRRTEKELRRMSEAGVERTEERMQSFTGSLASVKENLRRLAETAKAEAERIRLDEGTVHARIPGGPKPGFWAKFLRRQTRGWERNFIRLAKDVEQVLNGEKDA